MEFGKSAANFDSPPAESCPNGRQNADCRTVEIACTISELHALPPKLAGKRCTQQLGSQPSVGQLTPLAYSERYLPVAIGRIQSRSRCACGA